MSAERLRDAATVLRDHAAAATLGPWEVIPTVLPSIVAPDDDDDGYWTDVAGSFEREEDANYVALMHPGIGCAVADWLDAIADSLEEAEGVSEFYHMADPDCDCASHREVHAAFTVADRILGGSE